MRLKLQKRNKSKKENNAFVETRTKDHLSEISHVCHIRARYTINPFVHGSIVNMSIYDSLRRHVTGRGELGQPTRKERELY